MSKQKTLQILCYGNRSRCFLMILGVSLSLATRAECPCETQDQTGLRLAYENAVAKQNHLLADDVVASPSFGGGDSAHGDPPGISIHRCRWNNGLMICYRG